MKLEGGARRPWGAWGGGADRPQGSPMKSLELIFVDLLLIFVDFWLMFVDFLLIFFFGGRGPELAGPRGLP